MRAGIETATDASRIEVSGRVSSGTFPRHWARRSLPASLRDEDIAGWISVNLEEDRAVGLRSGSSDLGQRRLALIRKRYDPHA